MSTSRNFRKTNIRVDLSYNPHEVTQAAYFLVVNNTGLVKELNKRHGGELTYDQLVGQIQKRHCCSHQRHGSSKWF